MSWLHESGFDVEDVNLIEHRLDQTFNGVFGCTIRSKSGDTKGTRCGREDQIAAMILGAKVRKRQLDDVQGAHEVSAELIAEIVVILVFAGTNDPLNGLVGLSEVWTLIYRSRCSCKIVLARNSLTPERGRTLQ